MPDVTGKAGCLSSLGPQDLHRRINFFLRPAKDSNLGPQAGKPGGNMQINPAGAACHKGALSLEQPIGENIGHGTSLSIPSTPLSGLISKI
jgi:hypothetical protein